MNWRRASPIFPTVKRNSPARKKKSKQRPVFSLVFIALILSAAVIFSLQQRGPSRVARQVNNPTGSNPTVSSPLNRAANPAPGPNASAVTNSAPVVNWRAEVARLPEEEQGEAYSDRGDELMEQGQFLEAAEAYRLAIGKGAMSESIQYNMGISLSRAGKVDEAIAAYRAALEIAPDYSEAHNNLGNLLMRKNALPEAEAHFTEATKINPEIASSFNNLGICLVRQRRGEEAIQQFEQALSLDEKYLEARFNLAQALVGRGAVKEAKKQLVRTLEIEPNFTPARQALEELSAVPIVQP